MTWVVVIFNILMLIWVIGGASSSDESVAKNCANEVGDAFELCKSATEVGTGLGVAALIMLWVFGEVILGVLWLVTNRGWGQKRDCPACGSAVKRGLTVCPTCSYNFAVIAPVGVAPAAGWYADPRQPGVMRYWDGRQWTAHTAEGPPANV